MRKAIVLICFIALRFLVFSAEPNCSNLAFELGDFTNWQGYTWTNSTQTSIPSTSPVASFSKQDIMSDTSAYDAKTNYKLKKIPKGYKFSARLGDEIANTTAQTLKYSLLVDSLNCLLTYKFAVVLLNPLDGHERYEEPRFKVTLYSQDGTEIPDCSNYDVYASDAELNSSFNSYLASGTTEPVLWRDWTTVGANLSAYIGQTVTIEFLSSDCTHRGHYGYAYFVAECQALDIKVEYCSDDADATLIAPDGFQTYSWTDENNIVLGNSQKLVVNSPDEASVYSCNMYAATGCNVTLSSTIERFDPKPDFTTAMLDCESNEVQFSNTSSSTKGSLKYYWNFGDGSSSVLENPKHKFASSGLHQVSLELSNPPSVCTMVLSKTVESFSPPMVGIGGDSTYCPEKPAVLKAYGAYKYKWNTGSTADSIFVAAPGGRFWMIGYSSNGCVSDTIFKTISEESDWSLNISQNARFCENDSALLVSSGAFSYLWSTGETTPTIYVKNQGEFSVQGQNQRGCQKKLSVNVIEEELPDPSFTLSSFSVDVHNNVLTCALVNPLSDVTYEWEFQEKNSVSYETGSNVRHVYADLELSGLYFIKLFCTSNTGCLSSSKSEVKIVPFFPNVFTPNADGYNDVFAKDVLLQITDRYGMILYSGTEGWNGYFNNKPVDQDTYFYFISYVDYLGNTQTAKGSVALIR